MIPTIFRRVDAVVIQPRKIPRDHIFPGAWGNRDGVGDAQFRLLAVTYRISTYPVVRMYPNVYFLPVDENAAMVSVCGSEASAVPATLTRTK